MSLQRVIFDVPIDGYSNVAVSAYSNITLDYFLTSTASSITSSEQFENDLVLISQIVPNSIDSSVVFDSPTLNQTIFVESTESTVAFGDTLPKLNIVVLDEIESELVFGSSKLIHVVNPTEIESDVVISSDGKLNYKIYSDSILSEVIFGNSKTIMELEDVPFPSIESQVVIPNPTIKVYVSPLSLNSTVNFGTLSFIDNIHRLLVFKDDNISKVGPNDATIIAGGIRLNPSSTVSEIASSGEADLPSNPVGFLSINIDGIDYKMPYYNA